MDKKRIAWIDIYKCLVIVLVVVGHSTGMFNKYIYQFHMAAFFFISGYVSKLENKKFGELLTDKFFTLFLPLLTFLICGLIFIKIISLTYFCGIFFPENSMSIWDSVKLFFNNGDINVQFLGACWFISCLLGVFILQKFILNICKNCYDIVYVAITVLVYFCGYYWISNGTVVRCGIFSIDLICIAQIFFSLGCIIAKMKEAGKLIVFDIKMKIILLIGNIIIFWYFGNVQVNVMDYPSRVFNSMWMDFLSALNGILFIYIISSMLEHLSPRVVKAFCYIGKNSMGILFFHFLLFKFCFGIFYKMGIMPLETLVQVVPPAEVGNSYWFILSLSAILGSLFLWECCKRIPVFRFCTGFQRDKYREIYKKIAESKAGRTISSSFEKVSALLNSVYEYFVYIFRKHPYVMVSGIILVLMVLLPMYKQSIVCNDELQTRYWSYQGFETFYKHYFEEHIQKGRALSTPIVSFTMYLGFLGQKNWTFKLMQIASILLVAVMFGKLMYKLFRNKFFAYFCSLSVILFLPVTFEHTVPNAFVTLYNIPFALLLCSMILFLDYLDDMNNMKLIFSMIFLFVAEISYEAFVTFVPVYMMFVLYKFGWNNFFVKWKTLIWPFINAVIYLITYFLSGKIFASNYEGNQITGIDLKESFNIIKELFFASFPGHWLYVSKYKYLYEMLKTTSTPEYVMRIAIMAIAFGVCIVFLLEKLYNSKKDNELKLWVLICGILTVILPTVPISVSKMYQGHVGEKDFMALPVTFFSYIAAIFVCCYVIWQICVWMKSKIPIWILVVGLTLVFLQIQCMNIAFADKQEEIFNRLVSIEEMVKSEFLDNFEGQTFYTEDMFKENTFLAVHDSYWTKYATVSGRNIRFNKMKRGGGILNKNRIYINEENSAFLIWKGKWLCAMSMKELPDHISVQYYDNQYFVADCTSAVSKNKWYMEFFVVENDKLEKCTEEMFLEQMVGHDLSSCQLGEGAYDDGWLSPKSSFKIRTGNLGIVRMELYNPLEECVGKTINIYADGELKQKYPVVSGIQQIEINTDAEKVVECTIETDLLQPVANGEERELSIVLHSLKGI